jgi:hypothetical protein
MHRKAWLPAALFVVVAGAAIGRVGALLGTDLIRASRPEVQPDAAVPDTLSASSLSFPVRVQLEMLVDEVEQHVPVAWGTLEDPVRLPDRGRTRASVALRRSPFSASLEGATAYMSTRVDYSLRATHRLPILPDIGMSCGTEAGRPRPRLDVTVASPITLTPDWSLATRTQVVRVGPSSARDRDRCEVTIAGIDITGWVVDAAQGFLEKQRTVIDSVVSEADVRSSFQRWWDVLQEPIELAPGLWLELRPSGIRRGAVEADGDIVEIHANLEARPRVVFGDRPRPSTTPLPDLADGASDGGLQIQVEGVAEYAETSRRLTHALRGRSVGAAGRMLEIEYVTVHGIGGARVAVEVGVRGDARGTLYFVGTPRYGADDGFVSVPDLSLSVSTSNVLLAGTSWVMDAGLERLLREQARWPVDFVVDWARDALGAGLNSSLADGLYLSGSVEDVRVTEVWATTRGLIVRGRATGEAMLTVESVG